MTVVGRASPAKPDNPVLPKLPYLPFLTVSGAREERSSRELWEQGGSSLFPQNDEWFFRGMEIP